MFESSLIPTRQGKEARLLRSLALVSVAVQALIVAGFVVVPLIWPDALPAYSKHARLERVSFERPPVPKVIPPKPQLIHVVTTTALSAPAHNAPAPMLARLGGMLTHPSATLVEAPLLAVGGGTMSNANALGSGGGSLLGGGSSPVVIVAKPTPAPGPSTPLTISSGVSAGMLLDAMRPQYPPIARAAHLEGTVVVTAIIGKNGKTTGVRVLSGPEMLREAAAQAVREARYRPYLLNGSPTEVITTVSVTFHFAA